MFYNMFGMENDEEARSKHLGEDYAGMFFNRDAAARVGAQARACGMFFDKGRGRQGGRAGTRTGTPLSPAWMLAVGLRMQACQCRLGPRHGRSCQGRHVRACAGMMRVRALPPARKRAHTRVHAHSHTHCLHPYAPALPTRACKGEHARSIAQHEEAGCRIPPAEQAWWEAMGACTLG